MQCFNCVGATLAVPKPLPPKPPPNGSQTTPTETQKSVVSSQSALLFTRRQPYSERHRTPSFEQQAGLEALLNLALVLQA